MIERYAELGREIQEPGVENIETKISPYIRNLLEYFPGITKELSDLFEKENGRAVEGGYETSYKHSLDVASLAEVVADDFLEGENEEQIERQKEILVLSALLHDIGKDEVDIDIITKPGRLNDGQRASIQEHVINSSRRCKELAEKLENDDERVLVEEIISEIVLRHHFHSEGYPSQDYLTRNPDGKTEKMIDSMAQRLAIIDTFDALRSKRSYSTPLEGEQIAEILSVKFPDHESLIEFLTSNFAN